LSFWRSIYWLDLEDPPAILFATTKPALADMIWNIKQVLFSSFHAADTGIAPPWGNDE
jgi:hypothetical protein